MMKSPVLGEVAGFFALKLHSNFNKRKAGEVNSLLNENNPTIIEIIPCLIEIIPR
jgi:hypothetical protein